MIVYKYFVISITNLGLTWDQLKLSYRSSDSRQLHRKVRVAIPF